MKIKDSKIAIGLGEVKGAKYKVVHIIKDDITPGQTKALKSVMDAKIFAGETGQVYTDTAENTIYLGLGDRKKLNIRRIASVYLKFAEQSVKWKNTGLEIEVPKSLTDRFSPFLLAYQIANSFAISAFPVDILSKAYREREISPGPVNFLFEDSSAEAEAKRAIGKSKIVTYYLNGAREIEHLPANHFTPEEFVLRSKEIAKEAKLKITVFDEDRLKKEKFGGILSVAAGSDKKPKMIILEYSPKNPVTKKKLAIVGKGLTFDSGGISIKPSAEMHEMKYDMCGAAAAIHAIGAISKLGIRIPVVAAIGVVENMPDASATKPGDVYTAYNGTTVEVQNTDAEGRLVLGDVISYVCRKFKPEYMVDMATLTGAVIIALGHEAAGVMTNSENLMKKIELASMSSEDRVWELPLWEEYGEDLKSDIADVRNITGGRAGGTLSAAQFLQKFLEGETEWAHIDIAGTAWRSKPSGAQCSGPTGYGVRLMVDLAENLEKE